MQQSETSMTNSMRSFLVVGLTLLVPASLIAQQITFLRDGKLYRGTPGHQQFQKIADLGLPSLRNGSDFDLSPDGKFLAFNTNSNVVKPSGLPDPTRHIAVCELANGGVSVFEATPKKNAFGPRWSRDGETVAFQCLSTVRGEDHPWGIALLKKNMTGLTLLNPPGVYEMYVFDWTAEGNLLVYDRDTLVTVSPSGVELSREVFGLEAKTDMELSPSSSDQMVLSPDGKLIAYVVTVFDNGLEGFKKIYPDGGYGALMIRDRAAKTLRRITPKTLAATLERPAWTPDGRTLLFTAIEAPKRGVPASRVKESVYALDPNTGTISIYMRNASQVWPR